MRERGKGMERRKSGEERKGWSGGREQSLAERVQGTGSLLLENWV